ncbi:aquaporin [Brevundimonas sp. DC300-4]|uniref:aquaporin n=1 Tax=unclassified Brevundimonas TaxID=2622653 RepID=UPI003CF5D510
MAIGVTPAVIHIVGIQATGVSVNPARSFGPAVLAGARGHGDPRAVAVHRRPGRGRGAGALLFRLKVLDPDP